MPPTFFESRFCRFEIPAGWAPVPGLGAAENRSSGTGHSAVVVENWLTEPTSAAGYAAKQKEMLQPEGARITLLEEKRMSGGAFGDAHWMAFRSTGPGGAALRQEQYLAVEGPLAACLTLSGPEPEGDLWARAFDPILRSFAVTARDWLREIVRVPLLAAGAASGVAPGARVRAPRLQVELPVPAGWRFDDGACALRSGGGAEIALRRAGLPASSPDELFADALARAHRDPSLRPRRWDHAFTPQGWPYFALGAVSTTTQTWAKTGAQIVWEVFVRDESALAFRLQAGEKDEEAKAALTQVVSGYAMLAPDLRRIRTEVPWLRVELAGPWHEAGPGIFVRAARPSALVAAQRFPTRMGLRKFSEAAARALRTSPGVERVVREEMREVNWKGVALQRYALEFVGAAGASGLARAAWFEAGEAVFSVTVRGADAEDLFRSCLESLQPAEARTP